MSTETMKAIRFHEFGGPEVLRYEDAPKPKLNPGEVLVRVHAAGINPPDWYLRDGYKMLPPGWRPQVRSRARARVDTAVRGVSQAPEKVEMHLWRISDWIACNCGGKGARDEFLMAASAQNLRRMAGRSCRESSRADSEFFNGIS